ncbi:hypothetical protein FRB94_012365 [Tulasnella sp. JGI-2019a]|nr:hypothetical protein FRB94_012365 [Tulasnella sp. JGI-2019a]
MSHSEIDKEQEAPAMEVPHEFKMTSPGDCILRSSDGVDYKVFKNTLSLVSPVFQSMFDLPQTSNETPRGLDSTDLPVISVSESSPTLSAILLITYPCRVFSFENLDPVFDTIKAFDKYDIDTGCLQLSLRGVLVSDKTLSENPLGAYTIAWKLDMKEEAQNASRYLHSLDLNSKAVRQTFLSWTESGGLDAMLALWDLRVRRVEALEGLVDAAYASHMCPVHRPSFHPDPVPAQTRAALKVPNPSCIDLRLFLRLRQKASGRGCGSCSRYPDLPRTEGEAKQEMSMINSFPQTILWHVSPFHSHGQQALNPPYPRQRRR